MVVMTLDEAVSLEDFPVSEKRVTLLGATGSVGLSTLDLISRTNIQATGQACDGPLSVDAMTAQNRVQELIEQAKLFKPRLAVIGNEEHYQELKDGLKDTGISVAAGPQGLIDAASGDSDWLMAAIVGAAGLAPTLEAVRRGATIALANKECLVCAGSLFLKEVKSSNARLLPVDSEHNAIYQVFDFDEPERVKKVTLTASGGPFREWSRDQMAEATPEQAVKHPNWSMGAKISVDSATLMNKGLELIEAYYLFPVREDQLDVIVHPQSIIHSLVEYVDGSVLAQLGSPDMRTPIAYTLAWPHRMAAPVEPLDLTQISKLTFEAPDETRFQALALARDALQYGGVAPTVLNAANEVAVQLFLKRELGFLNIIEVVKATMEAMLSKLEHQQGSVMSLDLDDILAIDRTSRDLAFAKAASIKA